MISGKESEKMKKNSRLSVWLMAGAFVLCLVLRILQIILGTDMTSGFLYHDNGFLLDWGYYVLIILTFIAAIVLAVIDGKKGGFATAPLSDISDGRAAAVGFGLLLTGICAVYEGFAEGRAIAPLRLLIFIDLIAGALMVVIAFVTLYKKEFKPLLGFGYVLPGAYFMLRGVCVFMKRMVITAVPEYLIEVLSVLIGSLFFMQFSKLLSGNEKKLTRITVCGYGITAAVLTLSSALATIFAGAAAPAEISSRITADAYSAEFFFQANMGENAYLMTYTPWVNVAMGITAAIAVIVLFMGDKSKKAQAAELTEDPD